MEEEKEKAIKAVEELLSRLGITEYDKESGFRVFFKEKDELRDGSTRSTYTVSFYALPATFIDNQVYFAVVDSETLDVLYIMTPHGYIETSEEE